jgi:thiol:disulfide interchange protein
MRLRGAISFLIALGSVPAFAQNSKVLDPQHAVAVTSSSHLPTYTYDPTRNATADIEHAIAEAQKTGKRIILDVGGDWCPWCHALDRFFQEHPDLVRIREENFITVYVYYSDRNKNERALSRYSKVLGIPHIFLLDQDGTLLHSQHVVELQTGNAYSPQKMKEFLTKWSSPAETLAKAGSSEARKVE